MRVALLTREYPPDVYGGAGVHVDHMARALSSLVDVSVQCMGAPRPGATAHAERDPRLAAIDPDANSALHMFAADLGMVAAVGTPEPADVVHSHTWYTNLAGHLAKLLYGIPHVITAHSLEPLRPWKAEQLGGGYALSSWAERTAYEAADAVIAVSAGMRRDVLDCYPTVDPARVHVVHNGIDSDAYHRVATTAAVERIGMDPSRPSVVFVGRITRQKGVPHLLAAAAHLPAEAQLVLLAGAPDTAELGAEVEAAVAHLKATRGGVIWVSEMLPRSDVIEILSHATVFACPSVYEPQGIVNLEAMACETAVVASAVGGIPEVVVDGETGILVSYDAAAPVAFERGLAEALTALLADPARAAEMGRAGRARAVAEFNWDVLAADTVAIYDELLAGRRTG